MDFEAEIVVPGNIALPDEVPVLDKPGGKVIGVAKLKETPEGNIVVFAYIGDRSYDVLGKGITIGSYSIAED